MTEESKNAIAALMKEEMRQSALSMLDGYWIHGAVADMAPGMVEAGLLSPEDVIERLNMLNSLTSDRVVTPKVELPPPKEGTNRHERRKFRTLNRRKRQV